MKEKIFNFNDVKQFCDFEFRPDLPAPEGATYRKEYFYHHEDYSIYPNVAIPNGYTLIAKSAFTPFYKEEKLNSWDTVYTNFSISGLKTVEIPDSVSEIEDGTFEKCKKITIFCNKNSFAHNYCKEHYMRFEFI